MPSLYFDYKHSRIKQYHKAGRVLRTSTTIINTRDFDIGKRPTHLPALRVIGFQANLRLLDVQRISHDCAIGEAAFARVSQPMTVEGQRAAALRFAGNWVVQALLSLARRRFARCRTAGATASSPPRGRCAARAAGERDHPRAHDLPAAALADFMA